MVYITGDTHGDFSRIEYFCRRMETTRDDIMIILGDTGINYYLNSKDYRLKSHLRNIDITLFCIHGNHEERPYNISTYKTKIWHDGVVYYEPDYDNILFAKDGEIYDLNGKKTIVIGGAYSVDKYYRLSMGYQWFESEQPSVQIKDEVELRLIKENWKVDNVLSHTTPYRYMPREMFMSGIDQGKVDYSTERWLNRIESKLDYNKWYCGHYHCNKKIDKIRILFEDIVEYT